MDLQQRDYFLAQLKNAMNSLYGHLDGDPRINQGPCGPFALAFMQAWNRRFAQKVHISYIMRPNNGSCSHILVRLPDDNYYDGGNGMMSKSQILELCPGHSIDDTSSHNLALLNERAYGLFRPYSRCPEYDHQTTSRLINQHLDWIFDYGLQQN